MGEGGGRDQMAGRAAAGLKPVPNRAVKLAGAWPGPGRNGLNRIADPPSRPLTPSIPDRRRPTTSIPPRKPIQPCLSKPRPAGTAAHRPTRRCYSLWSCPCMTRRPLSALFWRNSPRRWRPPALVAPRSWSSTTPPPTAASGCWRAGAGRNRQTLPPAGDVCADCPTRGQRGGPPAGQPPGPRRVGGLD